MGLSSILLAAVGVYFSGDGPAVAEKGFFYGYNWVGPAPNKLSVHFHTVPYSTHYTVHHTMSYTTYHTIHHTAPCTTHHTMPYTTYHATHYTSHFTLRLHHTVLYITHYTTYYTLHIILHVSLYITLYITHTLHIMQYTPFHTALH